MTIHELVYKFIVPWLPKELQVTRKDNTSDTWFINRPSSTQHCGRIMYHYMNGLKVVLDDEQLVKELQTRVLIHNLSDDIQVTFKSRRA